MRPMRSNLSLLTLFFSASNSSSRKWTRFIKPMTILLSPICSVPHSLHSKLTGDSTMRGGLTTHDSQVCSPAWTSSFSPYGNEAAKAGMDMHKLIPVVEVGGAFWSAEQSAWFVKCRASQTKNWNMAVRKDNPAGQWQVDGGT